MSSGSARRGRRDNGLDAAVYAAAGDVDPRVGEHLLDVLAIQGIAAYLQPAVDLNPVTRSAVMPPRPTDRLFVDRAHLDTARDYLSQLAEPRPTESRATGPLPTGGQPTEPPPGDTRSPDARPPQARPGDAPGRAGGAAGAESDEAVDDAWAQIVASYDAEVDADAIAWPEAENLPTDRRTDEERDAGDPRPGPDEDNERPPRGTDHPPSLLDGLDTFGADLPDEEEDDEGYTPPPPPPLPRISKYAVLGILAILAGFVLFLRPSLLPIDNDLSMLIGFGGILAGFITLVWRLRPGDDEDDYDPDDGARV